MRTEEVLSVIKERRVYNKLTAVSYKTWIQLNQTAL